jgi:hypothetical protein
VLLWVNGKTLAEQYLPDAVVVWLVEQGDYRAGSSSGWAVELVEARRRAAETREMPLANQREQRITQNLSANSQHDWAGTYFTRHSRVSVSPKHGYVCFLRTGLGQEFFQDHGAVRLVRDGLEFEATGHERLRFACLQVSSGDLFSRLMVGPLERCVVVRWGEERYLVPPKHVVAFCQDVNAGRCLDRYLQRYDPGAERAGVPTIPEGYRKWLLTRRLSARLIRLHEISYHRGALSDIADERDEVRCLMALEVDEASLVQPGMRFFPVEGSGLGRAIILHRDGVVWRAEFIDWPSVGDRFTPPEIGASLSTHESPFRDVDSRSYDFYERLRGEAAKLKLE